MFAHARLRQLRRARNWTQREAAAASGVSLGAFRDLEQDRASPTFATVVRLADAFGVRADDFAARLHDADRATTEERV